MYAALPLRSFGLGERGFALLSQRWKTLQYMTASPGRIGLIARGSTRPGAIRAQDDHVEVAGKSSLLVRDKSSKNYPERTVVIRPEPDPQGAGGVSPTGPNHCRPATGTASANCRLGTRTEVSGIYRPVGSIHIHDRSLAGVIAHGGRLPWGQAADRPPAELAIRHQRQGD
jgi:hypothetical protein